MTMYKRLALAVLAVAVIAVGTAGAIPAGEPQRHVVGENEIQARIDQQISRTDADRLAIQTMLQREDVRQLAGAAGLDLERASAAAAVLSGPSLDNLAAQARAINGDLTGGDGTVVISATALIIILLILILLAH
jgi:hypothetical protein